MTSYSGDGYTMGFDDVGAGRDALLLVHGHPFDRSMWKPQVAALSRSAWRVVVPDLRGYGTSSVSAAPVTLDVFADDLAALLDHLGLDAVVIGGLSMGGQIVMEFCRRHSDRVRGVLLAATSPFADSEEAKSVRRETADRVIREGMDRYAHELLPKLLPAEFITSCPPTAEHVMSMMRSTDPVGAAAALRGRAERPDYTSTIAELTVPALVCVGSEDGFTGRTDAEAMTNAIQGSRLLWLEGVGHLPNLERPEEFNDALRQLLDRVSRS
jgi:pimeloyl-ACP methyl ester carboxylesterase